MKWSEFMPTYEYLCNKCNLQFEKFQQITEDPIKKCPSCAGPAERLISAGAGIIFKGSGFYTTDYRSSSYKTATDKEKSKDTKEKKVKKSEN